MGNSLGGKKRAKVMKINGETVKLKTPVQAGEVVGAYPGHVLLESEAVKHFGVRAKPMEPWQELKPKRLYFLVELPAADAAGKRSHENKLPRRVRSGINMSAKDRLESLMLSRRSVSDLSIMRPTTVSIVLEEKEEKEGAAAMMRVKMRLPKAEVAKLLMESKDEAEAAGKIVDLCVTTKAAVGGGGGGGAPPPMGSEGTALHPQQLHYWKGGHRGVADKAREKKVGFLPVSEGEIRQLAGASWAS